MKDYLNICIRILPKSKEFTTPHFSFSDKALERCYTKRFTDCGRWVCNVKRKKEKKVTILQLTKRRERTVTSNQTRRSCLPALGSAGGHAFSVLSITSPSQHHLNMCAPALVSDLSLIGRCYSHSFLGAFLLYSDLQNLMGGNIVVLEGNV